MITDTLIDRLRRWWPFLKVAGFLVDKHNRYIVDSDGKRITGG